MSPPFLVNQRCKNTTFFLFSIEILAHFLKFIKNNNILSEKMIIINEIVLKFQWFGKKV